MNEMQKEILRLKREKNAVILAHFYQTMDIQEVADIVGDSFELAKRAQSAESDIIVLCGVSFMAESAKILNPTKTVLLPAIDAGCPMADMIEAEDVRELRRKYPDAAVVCYVNSSVDVKAESDICCTSSSAEKIVRSLPNKRIIFIPDRNLGSYVAESVPEKEFIYFEGFCPIHDHVTPKKVLDAKAAHPDAMVLVHPECRKEVRDLADFVGSTAQILKTVAESSAKSFIIGTELGIVERIKALYPDKEVYLLDTRLVCPNMKKTKLEDVLASLTDNKHEILLTADQIARARKSLERMASIS